MVRATFLVDAGPNGRGLRAAFFDCVVTSLTWLGGLLFRLRDLALEAVWLGVEQATRPFDSADEIRFRKDVKRFEEKFSKTASETAFVRNFGSVAQGNEMSKDADASVPAGLLWCFTEHTKDTKGRDVIPHSIRPGLMSPAAGKRVSHVAASARKASTCAPAAPV